MILYDQFILIIFIAFNNNISPTLSVDKFYQAVMEANPSKGGCYLNDSIYEEYAQKYDISRECTPMCNNDNAIKTVDNDLFPLKCLDFLSSLLIAFEIA